MDDEGSGDGEEGEEEEEEGEGSVGDGGSMQREGYVGADGSVGGSV